MRWLNVLIIVMMWCCLLQAAETPVPAPVQEPTPATPVAQSGYKFTEKSHQLYAYTLKQTVNFTSAGDQLSYVTTMTWKFALTPVTVKDDQAQIAITILRIQATHDGPGSRRQIDSSLPTEKDGHEDALIGHLLAFAGAELLVDVNPNNGQVSRVSGGDVVIAEINKLVPALFPGDPPPLDAAAKAAFSDEALTRIWNQLLGLPSTELQKVPLGPPLAGSLERRWEGHNWTDALPTGTTQLQATLLQEPTPVAVTLRNVTGSGTRNVVNGLPGTCSGKLAFDLEFSALTQPVQQRHTVIWELTPLQIR